MSLHPSLLWQHEPLRWLSDGNRLCLPSGPDKKSGLLNVETGELTAVPISVREGMQLGASTFSPDGKRIAFVRKEFRMTPQGEKIYERASLHIMPVSGGGTKKLIHGDFHVRYPRWSPDGHNIAFLNTKIKEPVSFKKSELYVVSVASGQIRRLTTDLRLIMGPEWSPDGKTLAYLRLNEERTISDWVEMEGDLYIVPAAGGASKRITYTPEYELNFAWTPDGNHLTFAIDKKPRDEQWMASVKDEGLTQLQERFIRSSWSSDGKTYLVYALRGNFQRVSLNGSISSEFSFPIPVYANPHYMAPNGETILFAQGDSDTQCVGGLM